MTNFEPKTPGLFPIGGVARLAKRKRALDWVTFVLALPLVIAVFADMKNGPDSEPPGWVLQNLGYWAGAFFVVVVLRWRLLRCPECGTGFSQQRGSRLFSPLPAACGKCGLVLAPVVDALAGKPTAAVPEAPAARAEPASKRPPVRVGLILAFAVIAGGLTTWIRTNDFVSELPPVVSGVLVAIFVLFFGFAARRRFSMARMCVQCGRQGFGEKFCEHCGAMRVRPPA